VSTPTARPTTLRRAERRNTDTIVTDEQGAARNRGLRVRTNPEILGLVEPDHLHDITPSMMVIGI
jgi:hypothetical protein